ncbi:MAG: LON peptidase substrate-binding domain-containing protein [Myxococcota bacterium]|nr:LON peptidase substrate-binding domain-containing protein [Myxococcota bacterium]
MNYPLLPLRDCAVLPGCLTELSVGRPSTISLLDRLGEGGMLVGAPQRNPHATCPRRLERLHPFACTARIVRRFQTAGGQEKVCLEGLERVRVVEIRPRTVTLWAVAERRPAALTPDAGEAAVHLLSELEAELGVLRSQSGEVAVYRLAQALRSLQAGPGVLDEWNLDLVLEEVLQVLDSRQAVAWLH